MERLRRATELTKSFLSKEQHDSLQMIIFEQKALANSLTSLVNADVRAVATERKWAQTEPNPAIRDVFGKLGDIHKARQQLQLDHANALMDYRVAYKDVLRCERQLDQVGKVVRQSKSKVQKLQKVLDVTRKKADSIKIAVAERELEEAKHGQRQAEMEFSSSYYDMEMYKTCRVKTSLSQLALIQMQIAEKSKILAEATYEVAQLLPDNPPNLSKVSSYAMGPEKTDVIVYHAIRAAGMDDLFRNTDKQISSEDGPMKAKPVQLVNLLGEARDAFDILDENGNLAEEGMQFARPDLDGVPNVGMPLIGSKLIRQNSGDRPPNPPKRDRSLSNLSKRSTSTLKSNTTVYESPGYVVPNSIRRKGMMDDKTQTQQESPQIQYEDEEGRSNEADESREGTEDATTSDDDERVYVAFFPEKEDFDRCSPLPPVPKPRPKLKPKPAKGTKPPVPPKPMRAPMPSPKVVRRRKPDQQRYRLQSYDVDLQQPATKAPIWCLKNGTAETVQV